MNTATATTASTTGTYAIDPTHSRVGFVARHAMVTKVRGAFNDLEGTGYFDSENPTQSTLSVSIETDSIDTRNSDRDGHLRSGDFFDVETYPTINFVSTDIETIDESNYRVTGNLTIKDVTRPTTFDLELTGTAVDPWGNTRLGLEGSAVVSRKAWGLTWNTALDAGGVLVGDKVTLELEISAVKAGN
ncbi:MAG: YceI family protein [Acidimicrobiales bacterium]|nr:YceI family protein [Acidimicrobiales bacterium]